MKIQLKETEIRAIHAITTNTFIKPGDTLVIDEGVISLCGIDGSPHISMKRLINPPDEIWIQEVHYKRR